MNKIYEIKELYAQGKSEYIKSNYEKCISYFKQVIKLTGKNKHLYIVANSIDYIGHCYKSIGDNFFDKAEEEMWFVSDSGLGSFTKAVENFKMAIKYIEKAKELFSLDIVKQKLTKDIADTYIERCGVVIENCNYYIEKCNEKIDFIKQ